MKKVILVIILVLSASFGFAQTPDSNLNDLIAVNKSLFIGKPLDSIIAIIPTGYIEIKVVGTRKTARSLRIIYPDRVWIDLHVRQFSFMNPVDPNRVWNVSQIRLENLNSVSIYKRTQCYEGCPTY